MKKTNQTLMQRREAAVARGVSQIHPIFVDRAHNSQVVDVEGREYIDFAGGIAVLNTGHLHPKVVKAVQDQLGKVSHTCFQVLAYEPYVEVAERIAELVPGNFAKKTLLVTTGSEALENAVKIARAHTGRAGVIAFTQGYHGRTMMTLSMTGKVSPYSAGMGLMPGGVYRALFPDALHGVSEQDALDSIKRIFHNDAAPEDIAAIVIEPVQGEGGFRIAPPAFMKALRELCDAHDMVLVADEVQTGAGRTGTFFAMEQMGVTADLTTFAKSVAGGFPLAGVCGRADIMDAIGPGGLGGTYAGNPLACAAALAVFDVFKEEKLLERSKQLGDTLKQELTRLQKRFPVMGDVRGLGAMVAVEFYDQSSENARADVVAALIKEARARGLILLSCGERGNVLRLLMPLTIEDDVLKRGLTVLEECLEAVCKP